MTPSTIPDVSFDEFRRKSWVTAIPMEANARDVLSHARNVLSVRDCQYMNN